MKPKLLAVELWQVGDLAIASPFLSKASEKFDVTVLAKPFAFDFQKRFWPEVQVIPFEAPWTTFTFRDKYRVLHWPWRGLGRLVKQLRRPRFDVAVSGRWHPLDHLILQFTGAKERLGFPRMGSRIFLTQSLLLPDPSLHRYEYWRAIGSRLGLDLPPAGELQPAPRPPGTVVMIHTGAGQPVRVWPLDRYEKLVRHLRGQNHTVSVVCTPEQREWWLAAGESAVATPTTITDLLNLMTGVGALIGNDSGPGHLAGYLGIPTFTLFGPQVPAWFVPLHPSAVYIEGKPCPYKPCSDYCRFPTPHCLLNITEAEVCRKVDDFLREQVFAEASVN